MDYSEEEINEAIKSQRLVCQKLLEIMDLQADIDALLRDIHPSPFGSAKWKNARPEVLQRLVMMTAIQFVLFEPKDWVEGNADFKFAAENLLDVTSSPVEVAQREVPRRTGLQRMSQYRYQIRQLADELQPPESGKQSIVLADDTSTKVVLFAFAAGGGLAEHIAPLPAIIQIISGEASLTVGEETVVGKPGTWIQMAAKTLHSIEAQTPVVMLLTLSK